MKHGWSFTFALALFTLPALASAATPADELLRAPRYPNLKAAVHAFVDAGSEPVRVQRLLAADGSAYYRLEGEATGRRQVTLVDPQAPAAPGAARRPATKAYNVAGGSTRCVAYFYKDNNYGNLLLTTDLDWNDLGVATGLNNVISSLQTTCGGLWLAQDDNFNNGLPGYIYYVPAYTSLATLPSMNDSITSLKHDLP